MPRQQGADNFTTKVMRKILLEKVVTEADLLKMVNGDLQRLNVTYQHFIAMGFPIRRKTLLAKWNRTGSAGRRGIDRCVIFYME